MNNKNQNLLKTTIMACFLLMSFALAHAQQPYDFKTEEQSGIYMCSTKGEGYGVNEKTFCGDFSLGCKKDYPAILTWGLFPKSKEEGIDLLLMEENGITIKFLLSNGEVFETNNTERVGQLYWFGAPSTSFKSNKTIKQNAKETGAYFIGQLRKYNITKMTITDRENHRVEFNTNGFRSAVTIDAMCKTLMAKTGNQGQYGSGKSGSSTTRRPANSAQRNNTTPAKPASLIHQPALPKKMTAIQMVKHPFGVLKEQVENYTMEQIEKDLKSIFVNNVTTHFSNDSDMKSVWIRSKNNTGYDMSYNDVVPTECFLLISKGKVLSYTYNFHFLKSEYSQDTAQNYFNRLLNDLKKENIDFKVETIGTTGIAHYEGKWGIRTINMSLFEGGLHKMNDSWLISMDINFFD